VGIALRPVRSDEYEAFVEAVKRLGFFLQVVRLPANIPAKASAPAAGGS